jgi:parallel beta-helix repeat protein
MNMRDGWSPLAHFEGARDLVDRIAGGRAEPWSMTIGDLNADGYPDVVRGYRSPQGGVLGIQMGMPGPVAPGATDRPTEWPRPVAETQFSPAVRLVAAPVQPDFIAVGDFDADGHGDVAVASREQAELGWLRGQEEGHFVQADGLPLPGRPTQMAAGDVNRQDLLTDLVVGVAAGDGASLLVFEHPSGALRYAPEAFSLAAPISSVVIAQLDDHYAMDLAVATEAEIVVVPGRDRQLYRSHERRAVRPAALHRMALEHPVTTLTAGNYVGDDAVDLALLGKDGALSFLDLNEKTFTEVPYAFAGNVSLLRARLSTLPFDDLLVLDREQRRLHVLNATHFAPHWTPERHPALEGGSLLPQPRPAPIVLDVPAGLVAVEARWVNGDALDDLVVFTGGPQGGQIVTVETAPRAEFVVDTDANVTDANVGDGLCATADGACTFRAAIVEANASPGMDRISFAIDEISEGWDRFLTETVEIDGGANRVFLQPHLLTFEDGAGGSTLRGIAVAGGITLVTDEGGSRIEDTFIGTDRAGSNRVGTRSAPRLEIQDPGNSIVVNLIAGIRVSEAENVLAGNRIGVNLDNTGSINEGGVGVTIGANNCRIVRELSTSASNQIGLNGREGIALATSIQGTVIEGNLIYFNGVGDAFTRGIDAGGASTIVDNTVSGNGGTGIRLALADNTVVQGNRVGTNVDGDEAIPNEGIGIEVFDSEDVLIGGSDPGEGNIISGNLLEGLSLNSDSPVTVQGNLIGIDVSGKERLGNGGDGIHIDRGSGHVIGGTHSARYARNIIAANGGDGIRLEGTEAATITGNYIGTDESGTRDLGNEGAGVHFEFDASSNVLGGADAIDEGNIIAFSGLDGVLLDEHYVPEKNALLGNAIYANGRLGINLVWYTENEEGVNENDTGDLDSGPNGLQNHPELSLNADGSVAVMLQSAENTTYRLEFFGNPACDPSGHGEGRTLLSVEEVTTDADGNGALDLAFDVFDENRFITGTATDPDGNTSEFSNCAEVEATPVPRVLVLQDTLRNSNPQPVANTAFQIARIDLSNPADPFTYVDVRSTDDGGLLELPEFEPGETFFLQTYPERVEAVKGRHSDVDDLMYEVRVDNLYVDNDGGLHPDTLAASTSDTTRTILGHTSLAFNLVVSIEWAASDDYVDGLQLAFINANNFLYDVTNGQALLGKVAIYDDKRHWEEADIQIHASNTQWPEASQASIRDDIGHLHMPPKHFGGDRDDNVRGMYQEEPLNPNTPGTFKTIVHELGHYAFGFLDEYQNSDEMLVHPFTNFGFMDDQRGSDVMASEMSAFITTGYTDTQHFQKLGQTCWDLFREVFRGTYGDVRAEIHTPKRRGLNPGDVIEGPNASLARPDLSVGEMMEFAVHTSSSSDGRVAYLVTDEATNRPVPGARVAIEKQGTNRWIAQGKTTPRGEIRLIGAEEGDKLLVARGVLGQWKNRETLVTTSGSKTDQQVVALRTVDGTFTLLPEVRFDDAGALRYAVRAEGSFEEAPMLQVIQEGTDASVLPLTETGDGFTTPLNVLVAPEAVVRFDATDRQGDPFFVPQPITVAALRSNQSQWSPSHDNVELFLDEAALDLERLALLTSTFPTPRAGLPDSVARVSAVYALHGFPASAPLQGRLKIYYDADSLLASVPDAVTVFRWDNDWTPVPTHVNPDSLFQTATAQIDQGGMYAAFLDLRQTTMTGTEVSEEPSSQRSRLLHPNYPNPFQKITTITYEVERSAPVRLRVLNVLGQEIAVLIDAPHAPGIHEARFDASGLASGVYFYELRVDDRRETRTMLVLPVH